MAHWTGIPEDRIMITVRKGARSFAIDKGGKDYLAELNARKGICGTELKKDWIALHRKLLDIDAKEFLCISCLADTFGCDVEDLEIKIEEFKEQGCVLFK